VKENGPAKQAPMFVFVPELGLIQKLVAEFHFGGSTSPVNIDWNNCLQTLCLIL
jgi:hypothetical protein